MEKSKGRPTKECSRALASHRLVGPRNPDRLLLGGGEQHLLARSGEPGRRGEPAGDKEGERPGSRRAAIGSKPSRSPARRVHPRQAQMSNGLASVFSLGLTTKIASLTFIGEVALILWLLIKGRHFKLSDELAPSPK